MPIVTPRRLISGIAVALVLVLGDRDDAPSAGDQRPVARPLPLENRSSDQTSVLAVGDIKRRSRATAPIADAFQPRLWESPRADQDATDPVVPVVVPPSSPVQPPAPPEFPFAYIGQLREGERTTIFLTAGERSYVVREGEVVDDTYQLERIDANALVLTYLPLHIRHHLEFGTAPGESASEPARTIPLPQPELVWDGPPGATAQSEVMVTLSLPGAPVGRGEIAITYDPEVLAPIGATAAQNVGPGKVALRFDAGGDGAFLAELQFKVLTSLAQTTQLDVDHLAVFEQQGIALQPIRFSSYSLPIQP